MLCLRCSRGLNAFSKLSINSVSPAARQISPLNLSSKRTFTSLPSLRPTISPSPLRPSMSNPTTTANPIEPASTNPAMASMQIRCAGRNTFNPSHFVRKRRHGFLTRLKSRTGRMILRRRRAKKRSCLSH